MSVRGAAVRQIVPVVSRGVLRGDAGYMFDDRLGMLRGWASEDGMWRADTADQPGPWTIVERAANFSDACEAMAAHLRAAGFDVPPRPEAP